MRTIELPEPVEKALREHQCRVLQSIAILELVSNVLTAGGGNLDDEHEGGRLMSAIDGAIRILQPVTALGDAIALGNQLEDLPPGA